MTVAAQVRALQFGDANGLLGVATLPPAPVQTRPAVVFLNAGLIHRVGPFRMYVDLARRLAASGFLAVRVDLSGIGDSLSGPGTMSSEESAVRDARQALDAVTERFGVKRFVLVGLCAGAMSVHRVALADPRVVGACLLDGYAYRMPKSWLLSWVERASDPAFWRKVAEEAASRIERAWLGGGAARPAGDEERGERPSMTLPSGWPPRELVAEELDRLVARGVRMLFVYTGGWCDYVHRGQFEEMFPRLVHRGRVEVEYYPEADHTYLIVAHRERMMSRVEQFVTKLA